MGKFDGWHSKQNKQLRLLCGTTFHFPTTDRCYAVFSLPLSPRLVETDSCSDDDSLRLSSFGPEHTGPLIPHRSLKEQTQSGAVSAAAQGGDPLKGAIAGAAGSVGGNVLPGVLPADMSLLGVHVISSAGTSGLAAALTGGDIVDAMAQGALIGALNHAQAAPDII
jgi:hypothetical protein